MKIVIIGGVAAGAKVAAKTRRLMPYADIDLYTDDTNISYSSCGIPYYIEGNFDDYKTLLVRSVKEFEAQNVHIHLLNKVIKIIPQEDNILVKDLSSGKKFYVYYDKLVIATGSYPLTPNVVNYNAKNVFTIRKIEDAIAIKNAAQKAKNILILGSGYIGLEMLEAFVVQGKNVTVLESAENIAPAFDNDISKIIFNQLMSISNNRFNIHTSQSVSEFIVNEDNYICKVKTESGQEFYTDLVIIAIGVKPNVEIAKEAGIIIGKTGAIRVNRHMKTNYPNIYACGDCAEKTFILNGAKMWLPLGSTANKEGRIVAMNLAGFDEDFEGILASSVFRCLSFTMAKTGLTVKQAEGFGYSPISTIVNKFDKVGFMPDVNNILLKLIADKTTGLLLGGQAVGSVGADKRINTLTTALLGRLTIDEFMKNDLTYAPPFAPTIDPLINAAQNLYKLHQESLQ